MNCLRYHQLHVARPHNTHNSGPSLQWPQYVLRMWRLKIESLHPYSSSQPQTQDGIQVCLSFCFSIPCKVSSEIVSCTILDIGFLTANVQELRLYPIKMIQIFILSSWIIMLTVHQGSDFQFECIELQSVHIGLIICHHTMLWITSMKAELLAIKCDEC